jgi:dipeptidyl aminopeptidase/acylaminoacyl peptidase
VTQSTSANGSPQLSPDGKRLAFASSRSGHWEIYVANSDGSQLFQLTHFKGRAAGSSVWAPDGKQIAFDYRPGEHSQIYVIEANGGPERQMTFSDTDAVLPTYSRDGRWLYFARMRKDGMDVWKLPASGGTPALAVREAFCVEESVDGALLYYTKATDREMAIYSRPVDGGQEILLFREAGDITGSQNSFVVVDDGIYYRRRFPGRPAELMFYSFVHQRSDVVLPLPGIAIRTRISVSSDRTSLLATKRKTQDNIMLVENFR